MTGPRHTTGAAWNALRVWLTAGGLAAGLAAVPATAAAQPGTISGTVTNAATGAPVSGATVFLANSAGAFVGAQPTGAAGQYTFTQLAPETYYLYTSNQSQLLDEYFDDIPCPIAGCDFQLASSSSPVTVSGSARVANFALRPGGAISGTVRAAGTSAPLAGVRVNVYAVGSDRVVQGAQTDTSGNYLVTRLPTGLYYVATDAAVQYVDEFYDDVPCVGTCDPRSAGAISAVPVTEGHTTGGRNFVLSIGGIVTGRVSDAGTGAPVPDIGVYLYAKLGSRTVSAGSASTDAAGQYTFAGLAAGSYAAEAGDTGSYIAELYDDLQCPGRCDFDPASGADIPVALGATATANFALTPGGGISGTVRDADTSAPLPGVAVEISRKLGFSTESITNATTNAAGVYTVRGLPTGSYTAHTSSAGPYIDEVYDDQPCLACDDSGGTPIAVVTGVTTTGRDFRLATGGSISGTVRFANTLTTLRDIEVDAVAVVAGRPALVRRSLTNTSGTFTLAGLPAGTYYVHTRNGGSLVDRVYGGAECIACTPDDVVATGTPVEVIGRTATTGRNFNLAPGGKMAGTIRDAATQARLAGVYVFIYTVSGGEVRQVAAAGADLLGRYVVPRLPAGRYVAATAASAQYVNEINVDVPCVGPTLCTDAAIAGPGVTPVVVTAGLTTTVDYGLQTRHEPPGPPAFLRAAASAFRVTFTWNPPASGSPATSYLVEAGLTPGAPTVSLAATGPSLSVPGVPAGRYFVRVRGVNTFGTGAPSNEVAVVVAGSGSSLAASPEQLSGFLTGTRLTLTWSVPESGVATGYVLEAGTASGRADLGALPLAAQSFSYDPVPAGVYFLRVRAVNAAGVGPPSNEVMIVAGGVPSPPDPPRLRALTVTGSTVTFAWTAPAGPVSSYVLEAGTASGLANLAVFNTGNANTSTTVTGVPSGTYFVRLRAVNGVGVSVVSSEWTVEVP